MGLFGFFLVLTYLKASPVPFPTTSAFFASFLQWLWSASLTLLGKPQGHKTMEEFSFYSLEVPNQVWLEPYIHLPHSLGDSFLVFFSKARYALACGCLSPASTSGLPEIFFFLCLCLFCIRIGSLFSIPLDSVLPYCNGLRLCYIIIYIYIYQYLWRHCF